jgi:hypothetical protein
MRGGVKGVRETEYNNEGRHRAKSIDNQKLT